MRYIDADELLTRLPEDLPYKASVKRVLIQAPTADVVEVKHGEWREDTEYYDDGYSECNIRKVFCCSICGRTEKRKEPYCNCGAKMNAERKAEE